MDTAKIMEKAREYIAAEKNGLFRKQVEDLIEKKDGDELNDRFYADLDFGTGGLRGVIGGGYNRMNTQVVRRATQGLANYVKKHVAESARSAVIAYDSRNFSDTFALDAALVLAANGIKTFLFTGLRPTPELSFAVRHLKTTTGIVITASHNPPQYNGYKAYWNDGGQVVPPHDKGIIAEVRAVSGIIPSITKEEAIKKELLILIDNKVDDAYIALIKSQALRPDLLRQKGSQIKVVYTPLHGSGGMPVERALRELGITITYVPEQREPDGNFPTLKSPNPEEKSAMKLACDLAVKEKADLVIGTDPDSDRIGIAIPDNGAYRLINGNQFGALVADYIFSTLKELKRMPSRPAFIKTIVTTELQRLIADSYGVACFDVLTGFKYICEKIRQWELETNGYHYIFGGEESYGFLVGTGVRDKDAVSAAAMITELALYARSQGQTIIQRLNSLYGRFGYFQEELINIQFPGQAGQESMQKMMDGLRSNPPASFAGIKVASVKDYKDGTTSVMSPKKKDKNIDLPSSNVLQFVLDDGSVVTARPSGTEPKAKFYISCRSKPGMELATAQKEVGQAIMAISEHIKKMATTFS